MACWETCSPLHPSRISVSNMKLITELQRHEQVNTPGSLEHSFRCSVKVIGKISTFLCPILLAAFIVPTGREIQYIY